MDYFVIHTSEDGDVSLSRMNKAAILTELTPDDEGHAAIPANKVRPNSDLGNYTDLQEGSGGNIHHHQGRDNHANAQKSS